MNTKSIWVTVAAAVLAFAAGFLFANTINRGELDTLRAENERLKATGSQPGSPDPAEQTLSDAEIQQKIAEADQSPNDFAFQKNLGVALYRYGNFKKNPKLLKDAIRILERADGLNKQDRDVKVSLGNAYFDVAYYEKTERTATADVINKNFDTARKYYGQALELKPGDAGVITDIGLTYFLQEPAEYKTAAAELERALKAEPNHERAVQFLVEAKWQLGDTAEAAKYLEQLKTNHPRNPMIQELTSMLTRSPAAQ